VSETGAPARLTKGRRHVSTVGRATIFLAAALVALFVWSWSRARAEARATDALIRAVMSCNVTEANRQIAAGGDVNAGSLGRVQPVGFRQVVEQMFVRSRRYRGTSILNQARAYGRPEIVKLLLEAGADPNNLGNGGSPPIVDAAASGDAVSVAYLLDHGAKIDARNEKGDSALIIALWNTHPEVANLLVARGADVRKPRGDGVTILSLAAGAGALPVMDACVRAGADVNAAETSPNSLNHTPLLPAAYNRGDIRALRWLLDRGALIDKPDKYGMTPLHHACFCANLDALRLLLARRANPNARSQSGDMPIHRLVQYGSPSPNVLQMLNELRYGGADVYARGEGGKSLLHLAAGSGDAAAIEWVLEQGIMVNVKDNWNRTPLMAVCASRARTAPSVRLLLARGADLNAQGASGKTALHYALERQGNTLEANKDTCKTVRALLDSGASITVTDRYGHTPIDVARQLGTVQPDVRKLLEQAAHSQTRRQSATISRISKRN
jgi:uncharacterized protein